MNIDALWNDLCIAKTTLVETIKGDAVKYGVKCDTQREADIEDWSVMMLIWAADYAARQSRHEAVAEQLLDRFLTEGLYLQRTHRESEMMPTTPDFMKMLYREFAGVMEKELPVRNRVGFAFAEYTLGKMGVIQGMKFSSQGQVYRQYVLISIECFTETHFRK